MQVLSRQRGVSLIEVLVADGCTERAVGCTSAGDAAPSGFERAANQPPPPTSPPSRRSENVKYAAAIQRTKRRYGAGFSLVELMITLAVAIVLIVIAVPNLKRMIVSNKLTTTANDIVGAINVARMEAIKRNSNTQVCGDSTAGNTADTLGSACGTQAGAVYALTGATATATAAPVRVAPTGLATPLQLSSAGMVALRFNGQGLAHDPTVSPIVPYSNLIADICTSSTAIDNHRRISMTAGSILVVATTSGACD